MHSVKSSKRKYDLTADPKNSKRVYQSDPNSCYYGISIFT